MMRVAIYSRNEGRYVPRDLDEEILLCDRATGSVVLLNVSAREIYLLCDGTRSEDEIAAVFAGAFGVDADTPTRRATTGPTARWVLLSPGPPPGAPLPADLRAGDRGARRVPVAVAGERRAAEVLASASAAAADARLRAQGGEAAAEADREARASEAAGAEVEVRGAGRPCVESSPGPLYSFFSSTDRCIRLRSIRSIERSEVDELRLTSIA